MSSTILENEKRTICPYCGERVLLNDLLFAGEKLDIKTDRVLSSFYIKLFGKIPKKLSGRELFCSRELPTENIRIEHDTILNIRTQKGTYLVERACYRCHNVLPEYTIEQKLYGIFAPKDLRDDFFRTFGQNGMDVLTVDRLPSEESTDCGLELWNGFGHLGVEIESKPEHDAWEKRNSALCQSSDGYLFMLPLDTPTEGKKCVDKTAADTLNEILDKQFHIHMLYKPTVFLLFFDGTKESNDQLRTTHRSFLSYLDTICHQHEVCFVPRGDGQIVSTLQETMDRFFENFVNEIPGGLL